MLDLGLEATVIWALTLLAVASPLSSRQLLSLIKYKDLGNKPSTETLPEANQST